MSIPLKKYAPPVASLLLLSACWGGPTTPVDARPGSGPLSPPGGLRAPVYRAQIEAGAFTSPVVIDFDDAPAGPIGDLYGSLGVTMVEMYGNTDYPTGSGSGIPVACNFPDELFFPPPGELLFDPPAIRVGFYILTVPSDNTTLSAYLDGNLVGAEHFDTGTGGSFAGVEFGTPFDRLSVDPEDTYSGVFCMDDLMFEPSGDVAVDIDIKPGSDVNPVNLRSMGVVPVAILGSAELDVTDIDVTTLTFGPAAAGPAHDLTDPAIRAGHLQDANGDGFVDLVAHFRQGETGLAPGDTEACIGGATLEGTEITGCDVVSTDADAGGSRRR